MLELNPDDMIPVSTYEEAKMWLVLVYITEGEVQAVYKVYNGKKDFNKHTINQNKDLFIQI